MDYPTDQEMLSGCISGDGRAQEAFVRRFSDLVYRAVQYAFRSRNAPVSRADVDDLHNTVFVRLFEKSFRKLSQYKGKNGCSLSSWIRLIAVRTVIDHLRRAQTDALTRPERVLPLETLPELKAEGAEPWALMDKEEQWRLILDGLRSLLPRDRLVLKLHCIKGLPMREVACLLSVSEENAHSMKHRAIKRLKTSIFQTART
jgi:RNA polymerase sigma factor (sigma-70 family)